MKTLNATRIKLSHLGEVPKAEGAEQLFSLGNFNLWKITPKAGRFIAGFGQAFNLVPEALVKVSSL